MGSPSRSSSRRGRAGPRIGNVTIELVRAAHWVGQSEAPPQIPPKARTADLCGDSMWQLEYVRADNLPRLAWCAVLTKNENTVVVKHGPWLATTDRGFVEGAWSGPYAEMGFAAAITFTGSGGLLTPSGLLLV